MHMFAIKARNNFESTRAEVERLMKRIRSAEEDFKAPSCFTMEGYLYIQEKRETYRISCLLMSLTPSRKSKPKMCAIGHRSSGECVDQTLLYVWKKLQDVHHEQHGGQTGQQTGQNTLICRGFTHQLRTYYYKEWICVVEIVHFYVNV